MISYGITNTGQIITMAKEICNVIGNGSNNNAHKIVIETVNQETQMGRYRDKTPYGAGIGLAQFDLIGFKDVKERTRPHIRRKINDFYGMRIDKVQHRELAYSAFQSLVFCRLFYLLRPEPIPLKLKDRAKLWKLHYNTAKGKGTVKEYVENAHRLGFEYL